MKRLLATLSVCSALLLAGSCVSINPDSNRQVEYQGSTIATNVEDCRAFLYRSTGEPVDKLNPGRIDLLSWNVKKGSMDGLNSDLRTIAAGKELVILQEVDLDTGIERQLGSARYESFSQGFTTRSRTTGVATYSASEPLSECHLVSTEPWLRTPKATSITVYDLAEHDQNLLVVNVHAVNISLGLARYRDQMEQIRQVVAAHEGPAILSGDFNTWRPKRMELVAHMVNELSFTPVAIKADHRTRFYGNALDHVFVRGLTVQKSRTRRVTSSDHNPISVELRL